MQTDTVLLFHLLDGTNSSAKVSELGEFLLDCLQPFMPLAVSDLRLCFISALTPILVIQFLKVSDLNAETPDLFPKHCQMIHTIKNSSSTASLWPCFLGGRIKWQGISGP